MWQDTVIAGCQFVAVISLIPTIMGKDKPAFSTSLMNMVLVAIIAFCLGTLQLWVSVFTASLISLCWTVLVLQNLRARKAEVVRENVDREE